MKKSIPLFIIWVLCTLLPNTVISQTASVWVTINDTADLPYRNTDGMLVSNDAVFNTYIQQLQIFSAEQALPASRNENLLKVYELTCQCTISELKSTLVQFVPAVQNVENAPVYDTLHTPNDYQILPGINQYALNVINAQQAWDLTTGDTNVVIAVCDMDYSANHSELVGKYIHLYQGGLTPTHGNAVSILAAGNTNNNNGLSAIGYHCKMGLYGMNYNEMLMAAYAGAKIISLSWSSGCFYNPYEQQCINEAYSTGATIFAAAGNGSTCGGAWNYVYPAAYNNVFAVTSIGQNDNHIEYGNDTTATHQHNDMVDLSAPGYDVTISPIEGWYINSSGTSFATPYVAGTAGLMLSVNPCLSRKDIDSILRISSVYIDNLNPAFAGKLGAGRLNAYNAVQLAAGWATQPMAVTTQPGNVTINTGGTIQLSTASTSSFPVYRWQRDSLGVFVNLINNSTYSGVSTATLTITNIPNTLNNQAYRCVMSSGLCEAITTPAILTINNNIVLPDSAEAIQFPTQICLGDTIQFFTDTVNNATGYTWNISGNSTIIAGQNTTSVLVYISDTAFTITVTPVNSFGSGIGTTTSVQLGPIATASFTGGVSICSGDTATLTLQLTGNSPWSGLINGYIPFATNSNSVTISVAPTVTTDYILTDLFAGYCPGAPDYFSTMAVVTVLPFEYDTIQHVVCSSLLPYNWNGMQITSGGFYTDTISATAGCDTIVTLQLTVISGNLPAVPTSISQVLVSNTCNARIYRYTASLTNNAVGYQWSIPVTCGGVGPVVVDSGDINQSRIIRLKYVSNNAAFTTDSIKVRTYNSCGYSSYRSAKLINTALLAPTPPSSIISTPLNVITCGERRFRYTAPALPGATTSSVAATGYLWSFSSPTPLLAQIDSGTIHSQTIVVKYLSDAASIPTDSIYVQYISSCGNSSKRGFRILLSALLKPAAPSFITITSLNNQVCGNRRYRLTMPVFPAASNNQIQATGYQWSFTGNVPGFTTIDSGTVTSRIIVIKYSNDLASTIDDSICAQYNSSCGLGQIRAVKFSVPTLNPPLAPGFITITPISTNICGARIYRYTAASLASGTSIQAAATGYQWSFTGLLGLNAVIDSGSLTSRIIRMKYTVNNGAQIGDSVRVRYSSSCGYGAFRTSKLTNTPLSGCPPIVLKERQLISDAVLVFPNPSTGVFHIKLNPFWKDETTIRVLDITGKIVEIIQCNGINTFVVGERWKTGVYLLEACNKKEKRHLKLIKN